MPSDVVKLSAIAVNDAAAKYPVLAVVTAVDDTVVAAVVAVGATTGVDDGMLVAVYAAVSPMPPITSACVAEMATFRTPKMSGSSGPG